MRKREGEKDIRKDGTRESEIKKESRLEREKDGDIVIKREAKKGRIREREW